MYPPLSEFLVSGAIALGIAVAVYLLAGSRSLPARKETSDQINGRQGAFYIFDGRKLIDANPSGLRLIELRFDNMTEWDAIMIALQDDFPELEDSLRNLEEGKTLNLTSCFDFMFRLTASMVNGRVRLELTGMDENQAPDLLQKLEQRNIKNELDILRSIADAAPQLIWQEDEDGGIVWCNRAYLRISDKQTASADGDDRIWPSQKLFPDIQIPDNDAKIALESRHSIKLKSEDAEYWYNIVSIPNFDGTVHFASDANDQLRSERAQKAFIQTFAKTFAQLSVGLAIFDKSRQLSMFNPAFLDMTGLPASLLSSRPSIDTVFDRLRTTGKLPEPKDFSVWREQFRRLMNEATTGTYQETWTLPDGQMLQVTGRPHPDGAIAFLFEDITAEISLTRRFRTELQTSQAVLDSIPDGIAVFSPASSLVVSNLAYQELWNDPDEFVTTGDLRTSLKTWKKLSAPTPIWEKIDQFINQTKNRNAWSESFMLLNGRALNCQIVPITGGMTMLKFTSRLPSTGKVDQIRKSIPQRA